MLFLDSENSNLPIYFYINSPGGSVTAGLAIYDTMQYIKSTVHTICIDLAAGMGAYLLCAGTKGFRFSYPNAKITLLEPSNQSGRATTKEEEREMGRIKDMLNKSLADMTNQNIARIREDSIYWSSQGNH